jgi:hypothetical protein
MKNNYLFKMIIMSFLLVSSLVIAGCGGGGGGEAISYAFQDNFDSYTTANPWTPAGGWTTPDVSANWAIVTPGFSGNGLEFVGNGSEFPFLVQELIIPYQFVPARPA